MKTFLRLSWILILSLALLPERTLALVLVEAPRFPDPLDKGCNDAPGRVGEPPSGSEKPGSNKSKCPPCDEEKNGGQKENEEQEEDLGGMPTWWVSEPYVNLWLGDKPLSYRTASGDEMAFRFTYKQRYRILTKEECFTYYQQGDNPFGSPRGTVNIYNAMRHYGMTNAGWAHNWMMDIKVWDWEWEKRAGNGLAFNPVYSYGYETFVYGDEGAVSYFYSTNSQPVLREFVSQTTLQPLSGLGYPVVGTPVADANGIYWGNATNNGFRLLYPDGSQDIFNFGYYEGGIPQNGGFGTHNTMSHFFLTQRIDTSGRTTRLGYEKATNFTPNVFRVRYVVDPDGRTNTFSYRTNAPQHAWQLTEIRDPYGRTVQFYYGTNGIATGLLTNITDSAGLASSFAYQGTNGWITNLATPYGNTAFEYYEEPHATITNAFIRRAVYIREPDDARQLFYYEHSSSLVASNATPPSVTGQSFDDAGLNTRNSYHWGARQAELLPNTTWPQIIGSLTAADYRRAAVNHWLMQTNEAYIGQSISSWRGPSPDAAGQIEDTRVWYNYPNKTDPALEGDSQISCIALLLPDGASQYTTYHYYSSPAYWAGLVEKNIESYSKPDGSIGTRTNQFSYSTNGVDLLSINNSAGQFIRFAYNTNHQATFITNALNQVAALTYDSLTRNLITVTQASGAAVILSYSTAVPPTGAQPFLGSITFQPQGLVVSIPAYTNSKPRTVQTSGPGLPSLSVDYAYDGLNRLVSAVFPDGTYVSNRFDKLDRSARRDRLGNWTYFGHDGLRRLTAITNANNAVTLLDWCGCGALASITDPLQNTTTLNYNNQGLVTNVVFPDTSRLTYHYDLIGRLTNVVDGLNRSFSASYNHQGHVTAVSSAAGQLWQVIYDIADRPATIINANGVIVTNQYDLLNRPIVRTWQDGISERFGYATNGLIAYTNRNGEVTRFARDKASRLTAVTNANGEVTQFAYNAISQITNLIDGLSHVTRWNYNQFGWVTNKVDALEREVMRYSYDAKGQLTNRWMPGSGNTVYAYDAVGNLTGITYPGTTTTAISYAYDLLNRLTNMVDAAGTARFTYTSTGQLQSEDGPWASDAVNYLYAQGQRTNLTLTQPSDTWSQGYVYDTARRLQTLTSPAGSFGYDFGGSASALVRKLSLPNSGWITNRYDSLSRLDYTALANSSGQVLDASSYAHDLLGLRTNIVRDLGSASSSVSVGYDKIGQLKSWTGKETGGTARLNEQLRYVYDAAGNLHYRTNGSLAQIFTVDPVNELTNVTRNTSLTVAGNLTNEPTSLTINSQAAEIYDDLTFAAPGITLNNGTNIFTNVLVAGSASLTNTLTKTLPASVDLVYDLNGNLTSDGLHGYEYDADNQLTRITVTNKSKSEFVYDGLSRRRIRREYLWASGLWIPSSETRYVYDGMLVIQERDRNNTAKVSYTRGLDLSGTRLGAGGIGGLLARTDASNSAFYHADGSGNVTILVDSSGAVAAKYLYDSFGNLLGKSGPLVDANLYRFSSKEVHASSGLPYFGFRYYEPNLQRWLNQDPMGERGGPNLYAYVYNSPLNWIDPMGLDVFFPEENEVGGHAWVKIGGTSPTGPEPGSQTYGEYPVGSIFGKPAEIVSPDPHESDDDFSYDQYITTPEVEKALEDWIKKNYDINDPNSKRNPTYNWGWEDCRTFRNKVRQQLEKILKEKGLVNKPPPGSRSGGNIPFFDKKRGSVPKTPETKQNSDLNL